MICTYSFVHNHFLPRLPDEFQKKMDEDEDTLRSTKRLCFICKACRCSQRFAFVAKHMFLFEVGHTLQDASVGFVSAGEQILAELENLVFANFATSLRPKLHFRVLEMHEHPTDLSRFRLCKMWTWFFQEAFTINRTQNREKNVYRSQRPSQPK